MCSTYRTPAADRARTSSSDSAVVVSTPAARTAASLRSRSSALQAVSSVTTAAPARSTPCSSTNSRLSRRPRIATRSPGPMPACRSPAATRPAAAPSSAYVITRAWSVTAGRCGWSRSARWRSPYRVEVSVAGTAVRPGGVSAGIGRKDQGLVADVVIPVSLRGGPQAGGKGLGRQVGRHGGPTAQPARDLPPDHAVQPVEVDESLPDPYVGVVRVVHRAGAEVDRRERGTGEPVELPRADRIGLGVSGRIGTD